jgi:phage shock protein A
MNVLKKLNTLMRAGARESAERITDANAIRIYRQEIADAENLLERRRLALAGVIATRKDLEREISSGQRRVRDREQRIAGVDPEQRSEELLLLAARDIAATETHMANLRHRQARIIERIDKEELTLRKLVTEIREHRREVGILASQFSANGGPRSGHCGGTVAAHLATLRETGARITGAVSDNDTAEDSFAEAVERVDGDPLNRVLEAQGRDAASMHIAGVLDRLRGVPRPAEA